MGRRKRTEPPTDGSELEREEYIGHITTPVEDADAQRIQAILTRHAVHMEKIPTPDNWWTLFLPDGTTKAKKGMRGKAVLYTIHLPDGYCFLYRAPVLNYDKSYDTVPRIAVSDESEEVQQYGTV